MDNTVIGRQITKFRKLAGITQEELGKAVGVSTQAVSRWECGGAPDVALLPMIADRLGISIDMLFGREGGEIPNMSEAASHWFLSLPKTKRYDELLKLIWTAVRAPYDYFSTDSVLTKCTEANMGSLISSNIETDGGVYFGVNAEDMSFAAVCPAPEEGYKTFFADLDQYRRFFSVLAEPGCLEFLLHMLARKQQFFSAELLSKEIGMDTELLERVLSKMKPFGLADYSEVETLDGTLRGYGVYRNAAYVPFLYIARYLSEENKMNYYSICDTKKPLL